MSQSIITLAFEQYKAEQEATATPVELNEFVLANIPNQDPSLPINRGEDLPAAEFIVHVADTSQEGFVNPNAVVYSLIMDTTIGDFEFNWIGLRNKESGVIAAISHVPTVSKFKTIAGVQNGNAVTRSIMMSYFGAQALTNINVDASTWQIDFTARLSGMDERVRLANIDHYGHTTFLNDGFEVQKIGSDYSAKMGTSYLGGLRCHLLNVTTIADVVPNSGIYLDASYQGQLTSQWQSVFSLTCSETELTDYIDANNVQHYVTKIAEIDGDGNVIDTRFIGGTSEFERVDNAAIDAEIDSESKEKKHVKLPQLWRALTPQRLIDKLWLGLAAKICPVGTSLPWESDIAPDGWAIRKGQAFDLVACPKLAQIWPDGIIPDMRGNGFIGKEDGETVGIFEEGQVKEHGHPNSTISSTDLGHKNSNTTGNHSHRSYARSGTSGNGYIWQVASGKGTEYATTEASGEHYHSVSIGSHTHTVMIAFFGALKNTINHRKCNWIVRLA